MWPATLTGDLGLSAWYEPLNDIASALGKIGGAAQRRLAGGTVLHHVTMAYDIDADAMTLNDFGVAMYCGFGRQPGVDGMETMREHRRVVRSLREAG